MDDITIRRFFTLQSALIIATLLTVALLWLLGRSSAVEFPADPATIFAADIDMFKPEPLERLLFMTGLPLYSLLAFISVYLLNLFTREFNNVRLLARLNWVLAALLLAVILVLAWNGLGRDGSFFLRVGCFTSGVGIVASAGTAFMAWYSLREFSPSRFRRTIEFSLTLISFAAILLVALFCIFGINSVTEEGMYNFHFNSVFHAVVQVYLGKQLLVDLKHIYGLYPHFIEPVFSVIGLSVMRFTVLMALLMAMSLFFLYRFLNDACAYSIVARLGFLATVFFGYVFSRTAVFPPDSYFQYHPIRFLFPATAVYFSYRYLKDPASRILYWLQFVLSALAVLWNFDTGVVVFISWLALLLYTDSQRRAVRAAFVHVTHALLVLLGTMTLASLYLYARYGHYPDFSGALDYQRLFYYYGYYMTPMEIVHPWNLVLLVYAAGLVSTFVALVNREDGDAPAMTFFLSILGCGLFVYYQGRSENTNLVMVSYPALMLLTLFTDRMLSKTREGMNVLQMVSGVLGVVILCAASVSLVAGAPVLINESLKRLIPVVHNESTPVVRGAEFVRKNTMKGEEVLIISHLSGIYYLASTTSCPVKVPGPTELFTIKDYEMIYDYVKSPACLKVIVDRNFTNHKNGYIVMLNDYISNGFQIIDVSPDSTIAVYVKNNI